MVDVGMKPVDALKAGTSVGAKLLGNADRVGSLEPKKIAEVRRRSWKSAREHPASRAGYLRGERRRDRLQRLRPGG
jgi:Amidohydrolase family